MHTYERLVTIARPYAGRLVLVALLTSVGALAELVEPWVYRAIVNDIAGVFVSRETGLWPQILEELRGGAEPEASEPGSAPAPSSSGPAAAPSSPPASTLQPAPVEKQPSKTAVHRRPELFWGDITFLFFVVLWFSRIARAPHAEVGLGMIVLVRGSSKRLNVSEEKLG